MVADSLANYILVAIKVHGGSWFFLRSGFSKPEPRIFSLLLLLLGNIPAGLTKLLFLVHMDRLLSWCTTRWENLATQSGRHVRTSALQPGRKDQQDGSWQGDRFGELGFDVGMMGPDFCWGIGEKFSEKIFCENFGDIVSCFPPPDLQSFENSSCFLWGWVVCRAWC